MKKGMTRKIVAIMLVVMMLASVCFTYTASAAGLAIEPVATDGTAEHPESAYYEALTDGVKEGAHRGEMITVIFEGSGGWTDYELDFGANTTINTIVIYGAAPGESWNIGTKAEEYGISVNGADVSFDFSRDDTNAIYPVVTLTFDAVTASSFILSIKNNKWLSAIYEIEAYLGEAGGPEVSEDASEESSEATSEESSEATSEESSEATSEESSEESSEEPEVDTAVVLFDNSSYNWAKVYAYIYTDGGGKNGDWPGQEMNYDEETGLFYLELTGDLAAYGKVIFTEAENASTNRYPADQQPGLDIAGKDMLFSADHSWTEVPAEEEDAFDGKYFVLAAIPTETNPAIRVWTVVNDNVCVTTVDENADPTSEMLWYFELREDGSYKIVNKATGKVLDVAGAADADGANVATWESNDSGAQKFGVQVIYAEDGAYAISLFPECAPGKAIDLDEANNNILIWTYETGKLNQIFVAIPFDEEDVVDPVEVNYAAGKKYTTEGDLVYYGDHEDDGTLLTDGVLIDDGNMGQVGFMNAGSVNTITIDLSKKYTDIDKLVFAGCRISGNRQFADLVIEVSNNGKSFTKIDSSKYARSDVQVGDPMYDVVIDFNEDITARYVRLTCTNTEYIFSLSEIQVIGYGAEGGSGNATPGDMGIAVVSIVALISLAGAVIVSKRRFN